MRCWREKCESCLVQELRVCSVAKAIQSAIAAAPDPAQVGGPPLIRCCERRKTWIRCLLLIACLRTGQPLLTMRYAVFLFIQRVPLSCGSSMIAQPRTVPIDRLSQRWLDDLDDHRWRLGRALKYSLRRIWSQRHSCTSTPDTPASRHPGISTPRHLDTIRPQFLLIVAIRTRPCPETAILSGGNSNLARHRSPADP